MRAGKIVKDAKALILGITFKENCPDIRNTRVIDIYQELQSYGMDVDVFDPWASPEEVKIEYSIDMLKGYNDYSKYSVIIFAVAHDQFLKIDLNTCIEMGIIIFDVKGIFEKNLVTARL